MEDAGQFPNAAAAGQLESAGDGVKRLSDQLLTACSKGLGELVDLLLRRGADAGHARSDGWTALMAACSAGHCSIAQALLRHGADAAATGPDGFTAMLEACTSGHHKVVDMLLQHGAAASQSAKDGTTPLILACLHGHADTAAVLLNSGADVEQARVNGFTCLRAACGNGHVAVASQLLERGAIATGIHGATALVSACANGHMGTALLLLEHGVPATATLSDGTTALMQACICGRRDVASLLISHGADVERVLDSARKANLPGVRKFLGRIRKSASGARRHPIQGASAAGLVGAPQTPLCETRDLDELVREIEGEPMVTQRADVKATVRRRCGTSAACAGSSPTSSSVATSPTVTAGLLSMAISGNSNTCAEVCAGVSNEETLGVAAGPAPSLTEAPCCKLGQTVLQEGEAETVAEGQAEVDVPPAVHSNVEEHQGEKLDEVTDLPGGEAILHTVEAGSCAEPATSSTARPVCRLSEQLLVASGKGLSELAELLLRRGANAGHTRHDGWTALMAACSAGHRNVVQLLLRHGADSEVSASDGFTALLEACTYGHSEVVEMLLCSGASVSRSACDGTTPLMMASLHGHAETVNSLLQHNAPIGQSSSTGFTALRAACGNGHVAVARLLVQHGAETAGGEGVAALVSACANGQVAVVQLLLELGVPASSASADKTTALMQACLAGHREVASILVAHGAEVEAVLEAARGQNSLSGVQRVLSRVKMPVRPIVQETRDLDELVLQIEGSPQASNASPPRRQGGAAAVPAQRKKGKASCGSRCKPRHQTSRAAPKNRRLSPVPSFSSSSTSSSHSSTEKSSSASSQKAAELSLAAPSVGALAQESTAPDNAACSAAWPAEESAGGRGSGMSPSPALPPWPAAYTAAATAAAGAFALQRLFSAYRAPGTFYTVEVLGAEPCDATRLSGGTGSGSSNHTRSNAAVMCNAAVIAARCGGWPVSEISLIPLDATEIAEASRLAAAGISCIQAQAEARARSPPLSSSTSSLPDRDSPEEYAAWCAEAQQRCSFPCS